MKKLLTLIGTAFLAFASLTACNASGSNSGNTNDDGSTDSGNGESLPYSQNEASQKIVQLGKTQGFEITYDTKVGGGENGTENSTITLGFKSDVLWMAEAIAYKKSSSGGILAYAYDEESHQYVGGYDLTAMGSTVTSFDQMVVDVTAAFYYAYNPSGFTFSDKKTITFLDRSAIQYTASFVGNGVNVSYTVIIDVETGITLKFQGSGSTVQGDFGFAELVITSFKTGDQVRVPTLVDDNGGGSGDVTGDVFSNKKVVVTDVSAANDDLKAKVLSKYGRAYISLFADGTFEMVNPVNNTYDVAMGTFTIASDGVSAALNVTKLFDGEHQTYSTKINDELKGLVLRYDVTSTDYSLRMAGLAKDGSTVEFTLILGASNDRPTHVDLPAEQGGQGEGGSQGEGTGEAGDPNTGEGGNTEDLSKYLVTAAQYKAVVTDMAYIKANYNVKVDYFQKDNTVSSKPVILSGTFENANGVYAVADVYTQNGVETINRKVWAPNAQYQGYYDFYNQINNGEWEKGSQPLELSDYLLAQYIGLDVASLISLDKLNEPAYTSSPYYFKSSLTVKDEYETSYQLTNVRMYFEDGLLVKFNYTLNGTIYDFTYLDFGKVQVQLPEVADKTPVKHNEYLAGKQFEWSRLDKDGYTGNLITEEETAQMALMVFKFFDDNTYEMSVTLEGHTAVTVGSFECMVTPGESLASVKLRPTKLYYDGIASNSNGDNMTLVYNPTSSELMLVRVITSGADGVKHNVKYIYGLSTTKPVKYDPSTANPYPAEAIAKYVSEEVGAKQDTLPELKIDGASYLFSDGALFITLPEDMTAEQALAALAAKLTGWSYNSLYQCYLSPNKEISVYYGKNSTAVYILLDDCEDIVDFDSTTTFPSDSIAEFLEGLTDTLPSLAIEGSTYIFIGEEEFGEGSCGVALYFPQSMTGEQAIAALEDILTSEEAGFTLKTVDGMSLYVSKNEEIGVSLYNIGSYIGISIYNLKAFDDGEEETIELTLKVEYNAQYGQRVYLVGDFCNWDPADEDAIAFEYDEENNIWVAQVDAVVGQEIHCKLVVAAYDDPDITDFAIWEVEGQDNERVFTIPNQDATVTLVWGRY